MKLFHNFIISSSKEKKYLWPKAKYEKKAFGHKYQLEEIRVRSDMQHSNTTVGDEQHTDRSLDEW